MSTDNATSKDNAGTTNESPEKKSTTIKEGSAVMSFPSDQESSVFYNPVQVQNRDLSILMITLYAERRAARNAIRTKRKELQKANLSKEEVKTQLDAYEQSLDPQEEVKRHQTEGTGLTILEALAASGLRSVRYWKEVPGVKHITINDLEAAAVERAKDNLKRNNLMDVVVESNEERPPGLCVNHGDATHELYMSRRSQTLRKLTKTQEKQQPMWDVIDLDPYGSASPFLDGAVQAVESGGLLCITCTDMAALGGAHPETAYGRYAGLPIQTAGYLQELALRILLYSVATSAARYGRSIRPVLSVGMNFYIRVFVEVVDDKKGVTALSLKVGNVYQSTQCSTFITQAYSQLGGKKGNVYKSNRINPGVCPETNSPFKIGGPLWLGPLHDSDVVKLAIERLSIPTGTSPKMDLIATRKRLLGLLTSVSEEVETPLYYKLPQLCSTLHSSSPPLQTFKAGIRNAGYEVSGFHKEPDAVKTNAPSRIVWDVLRAWIKQNPIKNKPAEGSPAALILAVEPAIDVDFTIRKHNSASTNKSVARFPTNPEKHWGPKRKASGKRKLEDDDRKEEAPTKR